MLLYHSGYRKHRLIIICNITKGRLFFFFLKSSIKSGSFCCNKSITALLSEFFVSKCLFKKRDSQVLSQSTRQALSQGNF